MSKTFPRKCIFLTISDLLLIVTYLLKIIMMTIITMPTLADINNLADIGNILKSALRYSDSIIQSTEKSLTASEEIVEITNRYIL